MKAKSFMTSKGGALMISAMNVVIEEAINWIFGLVLFPTISKFELSSGKFIFIAQFCNLGFLILTLIANVENQNIPIIHLFYHESKTDFDQEWFKSDGQ